MSTQKIIQNGILPEQFTSRPVTYQDVDRVISLNQAVNQAKGYVTKAAPDELLADWKEPDFNLEESSILIENESGELIAYATFWDTSVTPVQPWCSWILRDDMYGSGVDQYLLDWFHEKAQRVFAKCPREAKITLRTNALKGYDKRVNFLKNAGFSHKRNFFRMLIEMDTPPPQATIPQGLSIRGMSYPAEIEMMAAAVEEGFKDHWGFVEEPLEKAVEFWTHYTETDQLFDPAIYFLAIDDATGKIAGVALCRMEQVGKPETAYVEELAVLPDYRRRGLALAMLHHAFGVLYKRGRRQVALHVDADSLTGATRLYEKAGMKSVETWMNFQTILRDGIDMTTTSVE